MNQKANNNRISTGTIVLDELLENGFEKDVITTIYGPAGSGKSNIALIFAIKCIEQNKKVVYIDTEGGFSLARIKQLTSDHQEFLNKIIIFKPVNFKEQKRVFSKLIELATQNIGAIIIDSISMLYRLELGKTKKVTEINNELSQQLAILCEITRKKNIPVVLTNQVYSSFDEKESVNMVGGDILKYSSKCHIELQKTGENRLGLIKKHRSIAENKTILFKIINSGLEKIEANFEIKEQDNNNSN